MIARRTFLGGAAAGAASSLWAARPARAQSLINLRVATIPIDIGAACFYAKDMGFFEKHGLSVEITSFTSGPAVASALIGGSLEIGASDTTVLAQGHEKDLPFVMVAPSGVYRSSAPTAALLVAKDSPITKPSDLAGKTIGVSSLRSLGEVVVRSWMMKVGLKQDDVKIVEIPFPAMDAALTAGRADAMQVEEPFLASMAEHSRVLARSDDAIAPQFIEGGFFTTLDYTKNNPDAVRRYADAIAETDAWANAHQDQSFAILTKYSRSAPPKNAIRCWYPERLKVTDVQPLIDASAKVGVLSKPFPARALFAPGIPG